MKPSSPPVASTATGNELGSPGTLRPGRSWYGKRAGLFSGTEGSDDPLKTGHVVCGNEYVHGELVKILKPLG